MLCFYHMYKNCLYLIWKNVFNILHIENVSTCGIDKRFCIYQLWKNTFVYILHGKHFYILYRKTVYTSYQQKFFVYITYRNIFYMCYRQNNMSALGIEKYVSFYCIWTICLYTGKMKIKCLHYVKKKFHMQYTQRYFCLYLIQKFCPYVMQEILSFYILHRDKLSISGIDKVSQFIVHIHNILSILIRNIGFMS